MNYVIATSGVPLIERIKYPDEPWEDAKIIRCLEKGEVVTKIRIIRSHKVTWAFVADRKGNRGYVSYQHLDFAENTIPSEELADIMEKSIRTRCADIIHKANSKIILESRELVDGIEYLKEISPALYNKIQVNVENIRKYLNEVILQINSRD